SAAVGSLFEARQDPPAHGQGSGRRRQSSAERGRVPDQHAHPLRENLYRRPGWRLPFPGASAHDRLRSVCPVQQSQERHQNGQPIRRSFAGLHQFKNRHQSRDQVSPLAAFWPCVAWFTPTHSRLLTDGTGLSYPLRRNLSVTNLFRYIRAVSRESARKRSCRLLPTPQSLCWLPVPRSTRSSCTTDWCAYRPKSAVPGPISTFCSSSATTRFPIWWHASRVTWTTSGRRWRRGRRLAPRR